MKLLIADDDAATRIMLQGMLEKFGYAVTCCGDGNQALDMLAGPAAPQLAIIDWIMPEIDGIEVCRRLRAHSDTHDVYVLMLTARSDSADIVTALDAGADDYLSKPFVAQELRARVAVGRRLVETRIRLADRVRELEEAQTRIDTLRKIVPICSHCKKIRSDTGYWQQVDAYVRENYAADFSHSVCPDCLQAHYGDLLESDS